MRWRYCLVFLLLSHFLSSQTDNADSYTVLEFIKDIERRYDKAFNYNPGLAVLNQIIEPIKFKSLEQDLAKVFQNIGVNYEISETRILIFQESVSNFQICGFVKDGGSGLPLEYASVLHLGSLSGAQTDASGIFELNLDARSTDLIRISFLGFEEKEIMINDLMTEPCIDIYMVQSSHSFESEIIIKDYIIKGIDEGGAYGETKIDVQQLNREMKNGDQDVLKSIQVLPGIGSIDESASNLNIRGGTADHNLILWEGVTLYDAGHLFGMISSVNPFVLENVKIYKGVFDPQYDNRVGGVVDMSMRNGVSNDFTFGVGSTLTEAHAFVDIPLFKNILDLSISGRKSVATVITSPTVSRYSDKLFQETKIEDFQEGVAEELAESQSKIDFSDLNLKLRFQPQKNIYFSTSLMRSTDLFDIEYESFEADFESRDVIDIFNFAWSNQLHVHWSERFSTHLKFIYSKYSNNYNLFYNDFSNDDFFNDYNSYNDIKDNQIGFSNQLKLSDKSNIHFGYQFEQKEVNYNLFLNSTYEQELDELNFTSGLFHNTHFSYNYGLSNFQLDVGGRYTFYEERNEAKLSPRLNLQLKLFSQIKWRLSIGRFYQYISHLLSFEDNELNQNNNNWILYDDESDSVLKSDKWSTGFLYNRNGWLISLDYYNTKTEGITTISNRLMSNLGFDEIGESSSEGIEFLISKKVKNYRFSVNYSYSITMAAIPELDIFSFANNHRPHDLNIFNNYTWHDFNFSLLFHYRSGALFSDAGGIFAEIDQDNGETYFEIDYPEINGSRLKDFMRLDASIYYAISNSKKLNFELGLSVINILNNENELSRNFVLGDVENEEDAIFELNKFHLRRTPMLLLRFYFE